MLNRKDKEGKCLPHGKYLELVHDRSIAPAYENREAMP